MEKITSTMVIHKYVDRADARFSTMTRPLTNNPLEKCFRVIRRGTHHAEPEDIKWLYEPVSDLWPEIEPDRDSSYDKSSDELSFGLLVVKLLCTSI